MKTKLFFLSLIASFLLLGACGKDDDDKDNKLSNTRWEYSQTTENVTTVATLIFKNDTDFSVSNTVNGEELPFGNATGTYTFKDPSVTFTANGATYGNGTVKGNSLTVFLTGQTEIQVFVKK